MPDMVPPGNPLPFSAHPASYGGRIGEQLHRAIEVNGDGHVGQGRENIVCVPERAHITSSYGVGQLSLVRKCM